MKQKESLFRWPKVSGTYQHGQESLTVIVEKEKVKQQLYMVYLIYDCIIGHCSLLKANCKIIYGSPS
jgi:hypothetical protein